MELILACGHPLRTVRNRNGIYVVSGWFFALHSAEEISLLLCTTIHPNLARGTRRLVRFDGVGWGVVYRPELEGRLTNSLATNLIQE